MEGADFTSIAGTQIWQLTALIVAVAALVRLFGRSRPHLAHALWLLVLLKCLTPPLWSSPSGVFCWLQDADAQPDVAFPPPRSVVGLDSVAMQPGEFTAPDFKALPADDEIGVHAGEPRPLFTWHAFAGVWMGGAVLVAAASTWRWGRCYRDLRRQAIQHDSEYDELLDDLTRRLGLRRRVRLLVTASRVGPAVIGLFRPVIILPEMILRGKQPADLEPILAHELVHVRRGDLWIGLLQTIVCAGWWFHPLVWLASRLISREAERCCDEEVIGELGCSPGKYARCLLDVLELKRSLKPVPAFPGVRPVEVTSRRLERIMKLGQGCRKRNPWWCWLVLLLGAAAVLPGAALAVAGNDAKKPSDEPASRAAEAVLPPSREAIDTPRILAAPAVANDATIPEHIAKRLHARGVKVRISQSSVVEIAKERLSVRGGGLTVEYGAQGEKASSFEAQSGLFLMSGPPSAKSESLTIELSGQVKMNTPSELSGSADRMCVRVTQDPAVELLFSGNVAIFGEDFSVHAEKAVVRSERLLLEGNAELLRKSDDGSTVSETLRAQRIEWDMRGGLLRADGAAVIDLQGRRRDWSEFKFDNAQNQAAGSSIFAKTYPVADLVVPIADRVRLPPIESGDGKPFLPSGVKPNFEPIIKFITTTIAPESWEKVGGPGVIQGFDTGGVLVISQTGGVHEQIADLISQLRSLQDLQVSLEIHSLLVTDDIFFERLGLDIDFEIENGSPTGLASLSEDQAKLLIEAAPGDRRATITQAPKVTLFNGQAVELAMSLFGDSSPEASDASLQVVPAVSSDLGSVRLTLAVGAKDALEALARSRSISIFSGQTLLLDLERTSDASGNPAPGQLPLLPRAAPAKASDRRFLIITPKIVVTEEDEPK